MWLCICSYIWQTKQVCKYECCLWQRAVTVASDWHTKDSGRNIKSSSPVPCLGSLVWRMLFLTLSSGCYNKNYRLYGLNNKHLFFIVLEAERSKIKVPADSVFGQGLLPGLQMAAFLRCLHMVQRQTSGLFLFLLRLLILSWGLHAHGFI